MQLDEMGKFEKLISDEMAKLKIGGLSLGIVKDDQLFYKQGIGARDLDKNLPANEKTIYNIASLTKSFICTLVMILVDEGKLKINDPIQKFLDIRIGKKDNPITIKHLMNHTSGLPNLTNDTFTYFLTNEGLSVPSNAKMVPITSESDFIRILNNSEEFYHEIDEFFHYSNYSYTILGMIINRVSGMDYRNLISERIFKPLKMNNTSFFKTELKDNINLAHGYHVKPEGKGTQLNEIQTIENMWEFEAAAGIYSCVEDIANYMIMHINQGIFGSLQIISKTSAQEMQRNTLIEGTKAFEFVKNDSLNLSTGYGFGFDINSDFYGFNMICHGGNMFGGSAGFFFIPSLKLGLITLTNSLKIPSLLLKAILATLAGVPLEKNSYFIEIEHYKKLAGIYEGFNETAHIKISGENSLLVVQSIEQSAFAIESTSFIPMDNEKLNPMTFYTPGPENTKFIVFFEDKKGEIWFNHGRDRFKKISKNYN